MAIGGNDGVVATIACFSQVTLGQSRCRARSAGVVISDSGPGSLMTVAQSVSGVLTLIAKISTASSFLVSADDGRAATPRWML